MDVIELERRAAEGMAAILATTTVDDYRRPTPCEGWDVEALIVHIVAGTVKYAKLAAGGDFSRGVPEVEPFTDAVATYTETSANLLHAWRQPGALEREINLPAGRGPAASALYVHLGETLVHGWDLAVSCGRRPGFEDEVVQTSLAQYASWLPPQRAGQAPFSDAVAVSDDAPAIDRLAAFLGRDVERWSSPQT